MTRWHSYLLSAGLIASVNAAGYAAYRSLSPANEVAGEPRDEPASASRAPLEVTAKAQPKDPTPAVAAPSSVTKEVVTPEPVVPEALDEKEPPAAVDANHDERANRPRRPASREHAKRPRDHRKSRQERRAPDRDPEKETPPPTPPEKKLARPVKAEKRVPDKEPASEKRSTTKESKTDFFRVEENPYKRQD